MTVKVSRIGDWMQTFTGKQFWALDPRADEVDIRDIAHGLSNLCRYGGHTTRFYSVAEHCVLMSLKMETPNDKRWALLHDASEAYLVDVPRPVKPYLTEYRTIEANVMAVVTDRFGLGVQMPVAVMDADNRILCDEREQAMAPSSHAWNLKGPPMDVRLSFWTPQMAEHAFLACFAELWPEERWSTLP